MKPLAFAMLFLALPMLQSDVEKGEIRGEGWMSYRGDHDSFDRMEGMFNRQRRVKLVFHGETDVKVEGYSHSDDDFEVDQINDISSTGKGTVNKILTEHAIIDLRCQYKDRPLQIYFKGKSVISSGPGL